MSRFRALEWEGATSSCNLVNKIPVSSSSETLKHFVQFLTIFACSSADCWCLWGTVNYSFCAYTKMSAEDMAREKYGLTLPNNETNPDAVKQGRCPIITGESLLCSDLASLGNCYDGAYSCQVDSNGFCNCQTV